jgi:hypothetical protein
VLYVYGLLAMSEGFTVWSPDSIGQKNPKRIPVVE